MFETTLWTRIGEAGAGGEAANHLISAYRPPLLAYLNRRGVSAEEAEDTVQDVFLTLFEHQLLQRADRERGRFRSYLLGITKKVLLKRAERRAALKRGGGKLRVSLDELGEVAAPPPDPEFDACWIEALIQRGIERLAEEHPRQHQVLAATLKNKRPQAELAAELGCSVSQVRSDLHRGRQRFIKILKGLVAEYSSSREEYEDEVAALARLLERTQG